MMTLTELKALWERYMHRNDLTADLDEVYARTSDLIEERLMMDKPIDLADILANQPRMYIHGGLMFLAELAQDQVQEQREMSYFRDAMTDYSFYVSLKAGRRRQSNPWFREPISWA